jgi:hypothetical protein
MFRGATLCMDVVLKFTLGMDEVAAVGAIGALVERRDRDEFPRLFKSCLLHRKSLCNNSSRGRR